MVLGGRLETSGMSSPPRPAPRACWKALRLLSSDSGQPHARACMVRDAWAWIPGGAYKVRDPRTRMAPSVRGQYRSFRVGVACAAVTRAGGDGGPLLFFIF